MNGEHLITFYPIQLKRNQAAYVCEQDSSHLLVIENIAIQAFINKKIKDIPLNFSDTESRIFQGWWTAAENKPNNKKWFWSTGNNSLKTVVQSSYKNWIGFSPIPYNSLNCMYLYPFNNLTYNFPSKNHKNNTFYNSFGGWLNKPCNFRNYFICMKSKLFF